MLYIYRIYNIQQKQRNILLSTHIMFPRIDHIIDHKASFSKFNKTGIIPSIFTGPKE